MQKLHTDIDIAATPEQVWEVLTDFAAYGAWNPFIPRIDGDLIVGSRLDLDLQPPGRRPMRMRPLVTDVEGARRFAWTGALGIRGVFDGHHTFELVPTSDGGTRLAQAETFGGLLARPILRLIGRQTAAGFESMNRALRDRAEARAAA